MLHLCFKNNSYHSFIFQTECTFQMGPVTISFVTESSNFQAKRFQRLEVAAREKETVKADLKNTKQSENKKVPEQQNNRPCLPSSLEDGEVSEEDGDQARVTHEPEGPRETLTRRKEDLNSHRRSRSSSRSPIPKRKRSSSPGMDRHLRSRPNERGPSQRTRKPRTPVKSYGYRNMGNSHFNSRSNRR